MVVPDVNLLVYAHDETSPHHTRANSWWTEHCRGSETIGIPWEVSVGFLRIVTHPRIFQSPIPVRRALEVVTQWFEIGIVEPICPGDRHVALLTACLNEVGIGGNLVPDAHLAAIVMEHRAVLHTNDRDFERFSGLRYKNPLRS